MPPETTETLKLETLQDDLKGKVKWFYAQYMGNGDLKAKFDRIKTSYTRNSHYDQGFQASAYAEAGIGRTAKYEADVYAKLLYVGLEEDSSIIADELVSGTTLKSHFALADVKDHIGFRGTSYVLEGDIIKGNDKDRNHNQPSFYYDFRGLPKGTEIKFSPKMRTESPFQRVGLVVIWELQLRQRNESETFNFNENAQTQSVTYTKQDEDSVIRLEVYWHDNEEVNTILELNESMIYLKKSF